MTRLKCKKDWKSLIGMITYVGRYVAKLSENTSPLRKLIKKDNLFVWDLQRQITLSEIKKLLIITRSSGNQ